MSPGSWSQAPWHVVKAVSLTWATGDGLRGVGCTEQAVRDKPLNLGTAPIASFNFVEPRPRFVMFVAVAGDKSGGSGAAVVVGPEHREEPVTAGAFIQVIDPSGHAME